MGKHDEQYSTIPEEESALSGGRRIKSSERSDVNAEAEESVIDEIRGAEVQPTWRRGDGLLC